MSSDTIHKRVSMGLSLSTLLCISGLANANVIGFSNGTLNSDYTYQGGASIDASQSALTLTKDQQNEHASWFYNTSQNVTAFSTTFDYTQTSNATPSDGMAFVIQNTAAGANALSTQNGGSGLGYQGMQNSAAIEFNLAPIFGPPHVQGTNLAVDGSTGVYNPTGAVAFWNNNETVQTTLTYSGNILTENLLDLTTLATYTTQYSIDLSSVLGSNSAFIGFTGATGGNASTQIVSDFSFTNGGSTGGNTSGVPASTTPIPAAIWLVGSALAGLIGFGRRKLPI